MSGGLRIGMVAGEASGDYLGSELIKSLKDRRPGCTVEGIGGPAMQAAGCTSLFPMETLSVMGLVEVISRIREITGIRKKLLQYFIDNPPDIFVGIDAPDFNLWLEERLRATGIKTVHYVSPQVWAWREYRIKKILRSVDLMLPLFPFEETYYRRKGIRTSCVGHPLARQIPMQPDKTAARERLGLPHDREVIAVMPGSRNTELSRLIQPFFQAALRCMQENKDLFLISNLVNRDSLAQVQEYLQGRGADPADFALFHGRSLDVLEAADVALLASGTITLEAMLYKRPMVVGYRLNPLTYLLARRLVRVKFVSLPNLMAGRDLVPECLQSECNPERLAAEIMAWLDNPGRIRQLQSEFNRLHTTLNLDTGKIVSDKILALVNNK